MLREEQKASCTGNCAFSSAKKAPDLKNINQLMLLEMHERREGEKH